MEILTNQEIKERLNNALGKLYVKDFYLLEHSAHERSITHKLAEYLQILFPDYDVDCEYNLDIENKNGNRKKWVSEDAKNKLKERLKNIKKDLNPENFDLNIEIDKISANFYPDIIIHKRGTNNYNLLVIEAKKHGIDQSFDEEKLKAFTQADDKIHHFNYQIGALVAFDDGTEFKRNNFTKPIYFISGNVEKIKSSHNSGLTKKIGV